MKKLLLSLLLCLGVGFAMMGSPAQVGDDCNGNKGGTAVKSLTKRPLSPIHQGRDYINHELKVKKIDATKVKKNGLKRKTLDGFQLKKVASDIIIKPIVDDPIGPPVIGPHGGGGWWSRETLVDRPILPRRSEF